MRSDISISIIGAGNLATQLGLALRKEGYSIAEVYSRSKKNANQLSKKLKAKPIIDLKKLSKEATIYIIAVKDDAIASVAKQLKLKDQIVVHTSGSVSIAALKPCSKNIGVFYPLQTFSKEKEADFRTIPICIEGNNKYSASTLEYFAKSISSNVKNIDSLQRKKIHLAAVIACNFSNHLFAIAEDLLKKEKLSLDLLRPLIAETAEKVMEESPKKNQTGPASRNDKKTMEEHLKLLSDDKDLQKLYSLLSKSILNRKL